MLRVNIDKIAKKYSELGDEELLELGRGGQLTPEARLALKTELLKRGHKELGWIDEARAAATSAGRYALGGWLWGLFAFVGGVYPALSAWIALGAWNALEPSLTGAGVGHPPLVTILLWLTLFTGAAVFVLGPLSVVLFRREDPRAPALTRGVLYLVLLSALTQLLTLGPTLGVAHARRFLEAAGWFYSVHAVLAGFWLLYLNHSRRVRRALCRDEA